MSEPDAYLTLEKSGRAELKEKGSRFIGVVHPASDEAEVKMLLQAVRLEYPKATHYCYAYVLGTQGNKFRSNDDGEPAGSAGKPILAQLYSKQLVNVLAIVVRYYGGTMLGVPGLISAYKTATALALQMSPLRTVPILKWYELQFDYTRINQVMMLVKQFQCTVKSTEQLLFTTMLIGVPKQAEAQWLYQLQQHHYIMVRPV